MNAPSLPPTPRFQLIDTLRGLSVLAIALVHFTIHYPARPDPEPHPLRDAFEAVTPHLDGAVQVFFVVSGFVIAYSLRAVPPTLRNGGAFILRRSLRLDPPYWAALALMIAAGFLSRSAISDSAARVPTSSWQVLANFAYLQDLLGYVPVLPVAWTLCIEVQLYLVFVTFHCAFGRRAGPVFVAAFAGLAVWSLLIAHELAPNPVRGLFLRYWYQFALGMLAAWAYLGRLSYARAAAGLAVAAAFVPARPTSETITAVATAGLILALAWGGRLTAEFRFNPFAWIGRRSYSIYLLHTIVGSRVMNVMNRMTDHSPSFAMTLLFIPLAIVVTLLASEVFYRFVERPSIALAKRLARKRA